MLAYEKYHGEKLSHFYGHSKLIRLLENLPNSSLEVNLTNIVTASLGSTVVILVCIDAIIVV